MNYRKKVNMAGHYNIVDLFAGVGGLALLASAHKHSYNGNGQES